MSTETSVQVNPEHIRTGTSPADDFNDDDFDVPGGTSAAGGDAGAGDDSMDSDDAEDIFATLAGGGSPEADTPPAAASIDAALFDPGISVPALAPPKAVIDPAVEFDSDANEVVVIPVYTDRCVRCRAFFPEHPKPVDPKGCHYTDGNTECPAAGAKIVIGIDVEAAARRLLKAETNRDTKRMVKLMSMLSERADEVQAQVLERVAQMRQGG